MTTVGQLVGALEKPKALPHIVVYYPQQFQFQVYDVVVAAYDEAGNRKLYGYHLKKGRISKDAKEAVAGFSASYWIQGRTSRKNRPQDDRWTCVDDAALKSFFGHSGQYWTPSRWADLTKKERKSRNVNTNTKQPWNSNRD
jgi:hypothetical protein